MATELEWHQKIRDALDRGIDRRDVWLALRVDADPSFPLGAFDEDDFVAWVEDWIGMTVSAAAGPVMPGTAQTEWTVGDNGEVQVALLLSKRSRHEGPLVGNPEPGPGQWVGE
jgi:hypothetical protein